jgi:hypothetical protein
MQPNLSNRRRSFDAGLADAIDNVFQHHPELVDHRSDFPWLTGCLGDPFADVWLVAENPSLTQVRRATNATAESQWSVSPGDKLLRQALVAAGLKSGDPFEPGGWRCWITDVIKSADIVTEWRARPEADQLAVAEAWAPVLRFELEHGAPTRLIVLGGAAERLLTHLHRKGLLPSLPAQASVHHYSYIGSYPDRTGRGPGHPDRVHEWTEDLRRAAGQTATRLP